MKKLLLPWFCLLLANNAKSVVYYWDPEATATPTAANLAGTWDTSTAQWSTIAAQTNAPVAFSPGVAACFSAGSTTVTTPFTVNLDSAITIGGIYNGPLAPPGFFVTLSGAGSLTFASGDDAFDTGGTDHGTTTITVPMTGPGRVALEGVSQIFFNATNTYSGGTILGYPGVASFSGTVNFNNGNAFGTGPLQMSSSGGGCGMSLEGAAAVTITNAVIATNVSLNITGNAAGLTFSGPWSLPVTPNIGSGGAAGNLITISGKMSGVGGFTKYNPGKLVLSGANTYSGGTTVSNGVLTVTADNNLGAAPGTAMVNVTLSGGVLNASNTFTLNSNRLVALTANSTISVSSGKTLSYAGGISGSFALSKTNSGTLALSGVNGYSGGTTLANGTLEADSQSGSAVGSGAVALQSAATLSGLGVVSGTVSGNGKIAPGTAAGPAALTLGNGLDLSSGGTYVWNLSTNNTAIGFSVISLIGGNLNLGGSSKLSINFSGTGSAPSTNNAFWLTQEAWTIVPISGAASNSGMTSFASVLNASYAVGSFTNYVDGIGSVVLLYKPGFAVFDAAYDVGRGFFGGDNLALTNFSGLTLYAWSTTDASQAVTNWTLLGPMHEQNLAPALPGQSRYSINVPLTTSPTYVVVGNMNTGPYIISPVPASIITTADFTTFSVVNTNVAISTNGVLALLPARPVILPGSSYSSGGFQLQFSADTNLDYTVQASSDFTTWTNIGSGTISNSPTTFTDTDATNYSERFYRISLP